jgi:hypothetical protein
VSPESVENRLERLYRRVTTLEEMPERIDRLELQMLQLRGEMRAEFSAVRTEIRDGDAMVVTAVIEQIEEARRHTSVLFEDGIGRIAVVGEGLEANIEGLKAELRAALQADIRATFEDILGRKGPRPRKNR